MRDEIRNMTVSRHGQDWYVSIQVEVEQDNSPSQSRSLVGIDLGVKRFATYSNGTVIPAQNYLRQMEGRLKKAQRKLAKKQKERIQKIHRKVTCRRLDFVHKTSSQLSKNHACVVLEALKIKNMSRSAKGDLEKRQESIEHVLKPVKESLNRKD